MMSRKSWRVRPVKMKDGKRQYIIELPITLLDTMVTKNKTLGDIKIKDVFGRGSKTINAIVRQNDFGNSFTLPGAMLVIERIEDIIDKYGLRNK